jgi:hypothetical protein
MYSGLSTMSLSMEVDSSATESLKSFILPVARISELLLVSKDVCISRNHAGNVEGLDDDEEGGDISFISAALPSLIASRSRGDRQLSRTSTAHLGRGSMRMSAPNPQSNINSEWSRASLRG